MEMWFIFEPLRRCCRGKWPHPADLIGLQAAVSNRSAGGKTPPFTLLLASPCRFERHFNPIHEFTTYAHYCSA